MYRTGLYLLLFLLPFGFLKAQEPVKENNKKNVSIEKKEERRIEKDKKNIIDAPENTKQTEVATQKRIVRDTTIMRERREVYQLRRQE